ncbi:MAG TPA: dTDP-4-dehydrorhamnose reductase [Thermomicrobiales bacterium]|nr:dTDP-4-dehydrorhamnose reductase [Thermomicrobiales bacterium]
MTGAGGQLGRYLCTELRDAGYDVIRLGHAEGNDIDAVVDISDANAVHDVFGDSPPDTVIHAAAYTDVDGCEKNRELANQVNHLGSRNIAEASKRAGAWLLAVGTDFVFSGESDEPYAEDAEPGPISVYGQSKLDGERAVLATEDSFAVARTSWVFGGEGKHFPRTVVSMLQERGAMSVVDDEVSSPTYAGDLARALVALVPLRPSGVLHLSNEGVVSRYQFAREVARIAGLDPRSVTPTSTAEFLAKYPLPAKRPAFSALANERAAAIGVRLPAWEDAVSRYIPRMMSAWSQPSARGQS